MDYRVIGCRHGRAVPPLPSLLLLPSPPPPRSLRLSVNDFLLRHSCNGGAHVLARAEPRSRGPPFATAAASLARSPPRPAASAAAGHVFAAAAAIAVAAAAAAAAAPHSA
ncbi:Protein of unknown function [Gryllus bimaculatus]|nr:Protein of unknown function [Gryllus bimaculatus]